MAVGKRIRHYREKLGWTLEELETRSGVAVGSISALENRDSSRSKFFSAIASAFGLTVEQLQDEDRDWIDRPLSSEKQVPALLQGSTLGTLTQPATGTVTPALGVEAIANALVLMTDEQREAMAGKLASLARAPDSPTLKKSISESLGFIPNNPFPKK